MENAFSLSGNVRAAIDRHPRLLQAGLIGGSLLAIAFLGYRYPSGSTSQLAMLAAGGVVAAGLAWILLRQPALGPIAVVVGGLAVPFEIGTGTKSSLNPALLGCAGLVGLWLLDVLVRPERRGWARSRTVPPLLGLAAMALVAFIAGQMGWFYRAPAPLRTQIGGLALFLLSIAAFLIVANRTPDERWLARLTWVFLGLGATLLGTRLLLEPNRLPAAVANVQGCALWTWLAALAFGQAVYNRRLQPWVRIALGLVTIGMFFLNFGRSAGWTAGWLPPLVAVMVALVAGRPRWGGTALLAGAAAALAKWPQVYGLLFAGRSGNEWSAYTRMEAWRTVLQLVPASPIIGFGPANYYFYTPTLRLIKWNVQFIAHNQYIDLLLETGVLGLGCFLWFVVAAGRLAWRLRERPDGFGRGYVCAALGGLAGMLVAGMLGDWIIPFAYNIGLTGFRVSVLTWLFLGGLVVLERMKDEGGGMKDEG